jgi:hypothetical protein
MGQPADRDRSPAYDHKLVAALDNPIRAGLLRLLAKRGPLSASESQSLLEVNAGLDKVAYQAWLLADAQLIEAIGDKDPRGGPRFGLTESGRRAAAALGHSPGE